MKWAQTAAFAVHALQRLRGLTKTRLGYLNPTTCLNQRIFALARIVRVRCRSRTVRSRIYQLADRHHYACTHIKFIKIRSFERACGPAEVGYSEQVARIRCISMRPTVSLRARIWACAQARPTRARIISILSST